MPAFQLIDTEGEVFKSAVLEGRHALVMFICNHCPFVVHIRDELARFTQDMMSRGLAVVAISSNDAKRYPQDGPSAMKEERLKAGYQFPYLYDETQDIAKAMGASCTPDFFLFDASGYLVYRGQFDESRPSNQSPVTGASLRAACEALLLTGSVPNTIEQRPSLGCNIKWREH